MSEEKHEYKCDICKHKHDCVRVKAFIRADIYPYSDGCESFEDIASFLNKILNKAVQNEKVDI